MKNLRFRLYDKINKNMVYPSNKIYINMLGKVVYERDDNGEVDEADESTYELMQYANVNDKNNIGIFEGDIYHQGDKNIRYLVVWNDSGLIGKQIGSSSYAGLQYWKDKIEIMGNIYENPELKEAK